MDNEKVKLSKKPKNPIVIEGFPGFGLIGTIATEFLMSHLECEQIGKYYFEDMPPTVAIHNGKVIDPVGIYYNKKYNIVIIHAISGTPNIEFAAAKVVMDVCEQLQPKELIDVEGVGSPDEGERVFYYSNSKDSIKKFKAIGVPVLGEGIIMGVTGALLLKVENIPFSCIFAESHTGLPDSKAAAKVIEALDKYLGLNIDYTPLLKQAEKFEEKLRGLLEKSQATKDIQKKKALNYVG
jgi:uncharacterized protein